VTVTNAVPGTEKLFAYILFHLRMSTRSFNFNCIFTQVRCLSVSLASIGVVVYEGNPDNLTLLHSLYKNIEILNGEKNSKFV